MVFVLVGAIVHRVLLEDGDPTGAWLEGVVDLVVAGLLPPARRALLRSAPVTRAPRR